MRRMLGERLIHRIVAIGIHNDADFNDHERVSTARKVLVMADQR